MSADRPDNRPEDRPIPRTTPRISATFDEYTLSEIRRAAATGVYDIRGGGALADGQMLATTSYGGVAVGSGTGFRTIFSAEQVAELRQKGAI